MSKTRYFVTRDCDENIIWVECDFNVYNSAQKELQAYARYHGDGTISISCIRLTRSEINQLFSLIDQIENPAT